MDENTRKRCRTCLKTVESRKELISLFEFDQTLNENFKRIRFSDMLSSVSNQQITQNEPLPTRVCVLCLSSIQMFFHFRLQVEKSYEVLRKNAKLCAAKHNTIEIKEEPHSFPMILSPRHVEETFASEDLLEEIDSDGIIDYEPEVGNDDSDDEISTNPLPSLLCQQNLRIDNNQIQPSTSKETFKCESCGVNQANRKALLYHKQFCHTNTYCRHCKKDFGDYLELKQHIKTQHSEHFNSFLLNYAEVSVSVERMASTSKTNMANNQPILECPFCMVQYPTGKVLEEHIRKYHPEENSVYDDSNSEMNEDSRGHTYQCEMCYARFSSMKSLNQHTTIKHKDRKDKNGEVEMRHKNNFPKYTREEFLDKFVVKKSKDISFCVACDKEFARQSINLHLRSKHAAVRSVRCELCPEAFFRNDYRQRHMASNHVNNFRCTKCNLQFDRAYKFDSHMESMHSIPAKNFKPEEGRDQYDLALSRIMYIESSKNYDYTDDHLSFDYSNSSATQGNVINTSANEIPLSKDEFCEKYMVIFSDRVYCVVCQQEVQKASLISHLLWKHALLRPLKCAFCNERVVKNKARQYHMSKCHPNEYKCKDCDTQFVKHQQLVNHVSEVHVKKCLVSKSCGEEEDLQTNELQFVTNRNEDDANEEPGDIFSMNNTIPVATSDRKFQCPLCPKSFTSTKNLTIHKSHKHKNDTNETYLNGGGGDESMSFEEFSSNWIDDVNATDAKCLVCELSLKKKNLPSHLKARHSTSGAYLCEICRKAFFRPEQRQQHMTAEHKGMFFCDTCNIQFYKNSRYAHHMKDIHAIEMQECKDRFEVDLNLCDLRFIATIRKNLEDDQVSLNSTNLETMSTSAQDDDVDPIEEMFSRLNETSYAAVSNSEELTRNDFIMKYIKSINPAMRHCNGCDKTIATSSIYQHLIHNHATLFQFKCPFCDLRLERMHTRARHMQLFHPNDYKCDMCGLQFQKHVKYADHMMMEHSEMNIMEKSPLEEEDLHSSEIRYVARRMVDDYQFQDEESNPIGNSTMISNMSAETENSNLSKVKIKSEPVDDKITHQVFPKMNNKPENEEMSYHDYKKKYFTNIDGLIYKCIPCDREIIRTSVCAHLRLYHATRPMFMCELCPMGFRRHDYRQRHMAAAHPHEFHCSTCSQHFISTSLYVDHMLHFHDITLNLVEKKTKDEMDIPLERMTFATKVEVSNTEGCVSTGRKRRLSVSDDRPIDPDAGGLTFIEYCNRYIRDESGGMRCVACKLLITKAGLKKHLKRFHATSRSFYCEVCNASFNRLDERTAHMETVHPNSFKCFICQLQFYYSADYATHMSHTHNQEIKVITQKEKSDLNVPLERLRFLPKKRSDATVLSPASKPPRKLPAKLNKISDDQEMTRQEFCKRFIRRIPGEESCGDGKFECIDCNKTFAQRNTKCHLQNNHAVTRPYGCEFCPRRFFLISQRVQHMRNKHRNENNCANCEKQFERAFQYAQHLKEAHNIDVGIVNNNDDLDIKDEDMRYTKTLLRQEKLASSEAATIEKVDNSSSSSFSFQDMKCMICNIEFDSSRSYRSHMRDHGGGLDATSFEIPLKTPAIKQELKEANFACDICEKKFVAVFALNAHKKFKHGINANGSPLGSKKAALRTNDVKQKFEIECEMCDFRAHRRDYIENHNKQAHKEEFLCHICSRVTSDYNSFIYHMHYVHPKHKLVMQHHFKCDKCEHDKYFKFEANRDKHLELKHAENRPKKSFFCECCNLNYLSKENYEIHTEGHKHKNIKTFFDNLRKNKIKPEKNESMSVHVDEPSAKKQRLDVENTAVDKLEYLKYLKQAPDGSYKCGICGKSKATRKFLLHHLKQHNEVPTFNCHKCPERFVFRRKYEKHLEMHGCFAPKQPVVETVQEEREIIENEHPKFQDIKKDTSAIKCDICDMSFKLKIQCNKHNTTWHADENPNRHLSMQEQKNKNKEALGVVTLLRCKVCSHAFVKHEDLKNHMKIEHGSENIAVSEGEELQKFTCAMCKLSFTEKQFLDNHTKIFCVHRNNEQIVKERSELIAVNEQ